MSATQLSVKNRISLNGNALKIIAAVAMTLDHVGLMFFPYLPVFRYIGRLAMPIFAYMIAEGCRYTRNKVRYFLGVFLLGVLCQTVYVVASGDWYLCVPISFAISILLIFALQRAMKGRWLWCAVLAVGILLTYLLTQRMHLDYGFWGCMLAVFAAVPMQLGKADRRLAVLAMAVAMVPLAFSLGTWQLWSFAALPLLLLYDGTRGRLKLKYFFYVFYPTHLALLQLLQWLL